MTHIDTSLRTHRCRDRHPLTDRECQTLPPPEGTGRKRYGDSEHLALIVERLPNGTIRRYWRFDYWRPGIRRNGKPVRNDLSLGVYPEVGAKEARRIRDEYMKLLQRGIDPSHHRLSADAQQSKEQTPLAAVSAAYIAHIQASGLRSASLKRKGVLHHAVERGDLGCVPIGPLAIDLEGFESWPRRLAGEGKLCQARMVCQYLASVFDWAGNRGYCPRGANPATTALGELPTHESEGYRAVTDPVQVGELLRTIRKDGGSHIDRMAVEFLALTFVRPANVWEAEWSEIDMERALWTIPRAKMKKDRVHVVPLSRQALTILRAIHPITGCQRYVWQGRSPLYNQVFKRLALRIGWHDRMVAHGFRAMAKTLLDGDGEHAFVPSFLPHRAKEAIELALAHGTECKVAATYQRGDMLRLRVELMQWWADRIDVMRAGGEGLRVLGAA